MLSFALHAPTQIFTGQAELEFEGNWIIWRDKVTPAVPVCEQRNCVLATFRNNMHGGFCNVNKDWRAQEGEEGKS